MLVFFFVPRCGRQKEGSGFRLGFSEFGSSWFRV